MNANPETPVSEPTVAEKLETAGLTELAETKIEPLVDALGLTLKHYGYAYDGDGVMRWIDSANVTIAIELAKLHQIIKDNERDLSRERSISGNLRTKVSLLEDYLDENWDTMREETRDELCDLFGIEREVTKTITITVTGTVEVTAPRGYDWDNIENDLTISTDVIPESWTSGLEVTDFSQDDLDVEAD